MMSAALQTRKERGQLWSLWKEVAIGRLIMVDII